MKAIKKTDWVQIKDYRSYSVINAIGYVGIAVHIILIPLFYSLNLELLAYANVLSSFIWIAGWLLNRRGNHQAAVVLMTVEVTAHTMLVVPLVGWHAGFQYYLIAAIPFTLFNNKLEGYAIIFISIILCIVFILLNIYTHDKAPAAAISPDFAVTINNINIIISFAAMCIISYHFRVASVTLEQEMEKLASTDHLTGLFNRRRMKDFLDYHGKLSTRNQSELSLIFVDIDHFKKINDTYGHDCGDFILGAVAGFMKKHLRQGDTIARWGGEEFLIMLPDTDIHGAHVIAEKIRTAVTEENFRMNGQNLSITMTFGLAQHQADHSIEDCLKQADLALYKGKAAGRNRVMS